MQLQLYDSTDMGRLPNSRLKSIEACTVFYHSWSRNAWHSTWVGRHAFACLHTTIESAVSGAEQNRQRGSVHFIAEVPALALRSGAGIVVLVEHGSDEPFDNYVAFAPPSTEECRFLPCRERKPCYLVKGEKLDAVIDTFRPYSRFRQPYRRQSGFLVSGLPTDAVSLQPRSAGDYRTWKSISNGGYYALSWEQIPSNPKTRHGAISKITEHGLAE